MPQSSTLATTSATVDPPSSSPVSIYPPKTVSTERHGLNFGDRAIEWMTALGLIWWAVALALPGDILSQPAFVAFNDIGLPHRAWAGVFGFIGGARLIALVINGRWPRTPIIRMIGAGIGFWLYTQIAWLFYEGALINHGPFQTGVGIYLLLSLADLFSIYRAARDARYYHS